MTDTMARWRGFTHEELYRMLHEGPGAPSSATPSRRWAELTAALDEVGHQLETALGSAGTGWTGRAAGAAYDRLMPLAAWAKTTSEAAAAMRVAVETQGDHIARARADMPVPEGVTPLSPDPTLPPAVQVVGAQADAEPAEATKAAAEQRAIEVMTAYENNTKRNLGVLTPFPTPTEVLRDGAVRRNRGQGVELGTQASGAGVEVRPGVRHGVDHAPGLREHGPHTQTTGSSAGPSAGTAELVRQRPVLAPGALAAAGPMESFGGGAALGAGGGHRSDRARERRAPAPGASIGAGEHHGGAAGQGSAGQGAAGHGATGHGSGTGAVAPAPAHPAGHAGAPVGAAGAPVGTADKMAARRFGPEAIGSTQWFADADPSPAPRAVTGRNRDLGSTDQVTENVSVDGEDHLLPPPVIGG